MGDRLDMQSMIFLILQFGFNCGICLQIGSLRLQQEKLEIFMSKVSVFTVKRSKLKRKNIHKVEDPRVSDLGVKKAKNVVISV
ncbi:hypothetical protein ACH5RR_025730 [Cinchona calisaya]|uniref:Uncharacterized protein n=1 Tax=Cinchona calisaya TaxID=153742 RepID=A0ABD2Z0G6_9GENT